MGNLYLDWYISASVAKYTRVQASGVLINVGHGLLLQSCGGSELPDSILGCESSVPRGKYVWGLL